MARPRLAIAAVTLVLLAGCGGQDAELSAEPPATEAGGSPMHEEHDHGEPIAEATWDDQAREHAASAAAATVAAYVREGQPEDSWWSEVSRYLTDQARHDYALTDPANVPGAAVTGDPVVETAPPSVYLVTVTVPTDAGDYTVLLSRVLKTPEANPWLAERVTPPTS